MGSVCASSGMFQGRAVLCFVQQPFNSCLCASPVPDDLCHAMGSGMALWPHDFGP